MYNTFWDPTVHPVNLHKDGEFAARISRRSTYWLQQRCLSGLYFNCEDIIKNNEGNWMNQSSVAKYYINPPYEARLVNERSEEHTSELQSLMRISYAVFCLKKKNTNYIIFNTN